jgi:hypothetical protein
MSGKETVQPELEFVAFVGIDWADQKHVPCRAVRCSGGFKSLWRSNEGRHIQKRG